MTLDKALTKKQSSPAWAFRARAGASSRARSLRSGGLDELRLPGHREAELRGLEQGDRAAQRRRGSDRASGGSSTSCSRRTPTACSSSATCRAPTCASCAWTGCRSCRPSRSASIPSYPRGSRSSTTRCKHEDSRFVGRRAPPRLPQKRSSASTSSPIAASTRSACATSAALDFRVGARRRDLLPQRDAPLPSLEPETARSSWRRATAGDDYDATIQAILRSAAHAPGLTSLLDVTKPRPRRLATHGAPRGARVQHEAHRLARRRRSRGRVRRARTRSSPSPRPSRATATSSSRSRRRPISRARCMASNVDVVFNIAEGISRA